MSASVDDPFLVSLGLFSFSVSVLANFVAYVVEVRSIRICATWI